MFWSYFSSFFDILILFLKLVFSEPVLMILYLEIIRNLDSCKWIFWDLLHPVLSWSRPLKFFFFQLASATAIANALIRVSARSVRIWRRASTVRPAYLASTVTPPMGEDVSVSHIHQGYSLQIRWNKATWFWSCISCHACQEVSWAWKRGSRAAKCQSS